MLILLPSVYGWGVKLECSSFPKQARRTQFYFFPLLQSYHIIHSKALAPNLKDPLLRVTDGIGTPMLEGVET